MNKIELAMLMWRKISSSDALGQSSFDEIFSKDIKVEQIAGIFATLAKSYEFFADIDISMLSKEEIIDEMRKAKSKELHYEFGKDAFFSEAFMILCEHFLDGSELYAAFAPDCSFARNASISYFCDGWAKQSEAEALNFLNNIKIELKSGNAVLKPLFREPEHEIKRFENALGVILAPANVDLDDNYILQRQFYRGKSTSLAYIDHIMASFSKKAIIVLPAGFGYRGNEFEFRKYLIDKNILEAVVVLPAGFWQGTMIKSQALVLNKQKTSENIEIITLLAQKNNKNLLAFKNFLKNSSDESFGFKKNITKELIKNNEYSLMIEEYFSQDKLEKQRAKFPTLSYEKLGKIATLVRSQAFKEEESGRKIIEISHLDFARAGFLDLDSLTRIKYSNDPKLKNYKLQSFDILLNARGVIGTCALMPEFDEEKCFFVPSQTIQIIRLNIKDKEQKRKEAVAMYMFFCSDFGKKSLASISDGTFMQQILAKKLKELEVPLFKNDEIEKLNENFLAQIELEKKLEELEAQIAKIHADFLAFS